MLPIKQHRDDDARLHNEDGAALLYPDGFGVWAYHGVRVPKKVIESPHTLTSDEILNEENAEIRRVMLLRYGTERLLSELGAELVDEVKDDQVEVGTGNDGLPVPVGLFGAKLIRIPASGDDPEPTCLVSLINSTPEKDGSRKEYVLGVPPDMQTVRDAVSWTFSVASHEYQPVLES